MDSTFSLVGHRGAVQEAPENTLEGFAHLRAIGIDHVELDVRLTADNQLVVIHDETVDRTTNGTGPVSSFTLEQLQALDASKDCPAEWTSTATVPSLEEMILVWPSIQFLQLEVKTAPKQSLQIIGEKIAHLVRQLNIGAQTWTTSSDEYYLEWMQQNHPDIQRGFVAYDTNGTEWDTSERLGCTLMCPEWVMIDQPYMEMAQSKNLPISAWTVNDISTAQALKEMGVHSVITDCPTAMIGAGL